MKGIPYAFAGLCGVLMAVGLLVPYGLTLAVVINLPLVIGTRILLRRVVWPGQDVRGLGDIMLLAVLLRWGAATFIQYVVYPSKPGLFAPDEYYYDSASRYYAEYIAGHVANPDPENFAGATIWATASIYYVVGWAPMVPKFLNGVMGGWSTVFTAMLASTLISPRVGRVAGVINACVPSLVLWSSLNIKDTSTLLGAQAALFAAAALRRGFRTSLVVLLAAGVLLTLSNRPYEAAFIAAGLLATVIAVRPRSIVRNVIIGAVGLVAILYFLRRTGIAPGPEADESMLDRITVMRAGYATGAASAVKLDLVQTKTTVGAIFGIPVGLFYFFFTPLPFTGGSLISIATTPEVLVWYSLIPAALRGMLLALRRRTSEIAPLLTYMLLSSIGWGMVVTNVGSLYRYRSQVFFAPIIFVATDWVRRRTATSQPALPVTAAVTPPRLAAVRSINTVR